MALGIYINVLKDILPHLRRAAAALAGLIIYTAITQEQHLACNALPTEEHLGVRSQAWHQQKQHAHRATLAPAATRATEQAWLRRARLAATRPPATVRVFRAEMMRSSATRVLLRAPRAALQCKLGLARQIRGNSVWAAPLVDRATAAAQPRDALRERVPPRGADGVASAETRRCTARPCLQNV